MESISIKNRINHVAPHSIAEEVGIEIGDTLLDINGHRIEDIIEYKYCISDEYLEITIEKPTGEQWIIEVEKEYDEDLGIDFENPILSHMKSCHNKCVFCFIDQLPPGMRESLYFKDDDSRLSFLHGNYITLTNMKEKDIQKIIQYRISPLNISVHTTNGELRKRMLGNRFAENMLQIMERLAAGQIVMNCQIVLCPEYNDGEELDRTLKDLEKLQGAIQSVAVVPVGLTGYREQLAPVKPFDQISALNTVKQIHGWQKHFRRKLKRTFVHLSDEFYLLAKVPLPSYEAYDDFAQLENGVGMMVKFRDQFDAQLKKTAQPLKESKKVTLVTGTLAYGFMRELARLLMEKVDHLEVSVVAVQNIFFGGQVSVSGLLTGQDILYHLKGLELGEALIIGENMLKSEETVFLDDLTVAQLEQQIAVPVKISPITGDQLIKIILESE